MGVLEDLAQARAEYERGNWPAVRDTLAELDPEDLGVDDLRAAARSAQLLGRRDEAVEHYQRAFRLCEGAGDAAGAVACAFLATPWAGRPAEQYRIAGILLAIGVVLWFVTVLVNRRTGGQTPSFDPEHLTGDRPSGPRN